MRYPLVEKRAESIIILAHNTIDPRPVTRHAEDSWFWGGFFKKLNLIFLPLILSSQFNRHLTIGTIVSPII